MEDHYKLCKEHGKEAKYCPEEKRWICEECPEENKNILIRK